jgi:hypothetical protein
MLNCFLPVPKLKKENNPKSRQKWQNKYHFGHPQYGISIFQKDLKV